MTQVKAFIPIDITDSMLISSSIAEPDQNEPLWVVPGIYNESNLVSVIDTDSHLVYASLQNANSGNDPKTSPTWWILKSYTNRHRMFEWNKGKTSVGSSPMFATLRPGRRINAITLEGIKAATAEIIVQDGIGGPVVPPIINKNLLNRHAITPYQFGFAPWIYDKVLSTFDVPPVADPVITMILTDPSGICGLSRFAVGIAFDLGEIEWDSALEDENNSSVIRNEFGEAEFNPEPDIPVLESEIELDANRVNMARQFKADANGKVVVFSGMESISYYREMHTIVGFFRRFKLTSKNHKKSKFEIRVEGL